RAISVPGQQRTHEAPARTVGHGTSQAIHFSHAGPVDEDHFHDGPSEATGRGSPHDAPAQGETQMTKRSENLAATTQRLLSVGHSNHALDPSPALLRAAGVTAVADVRSHPFSRRLPQFNRPYLTAALDQWGIAYLFLGDYLGGRPEPDELYDAEGRVDYERVRVTEVFREGLDQLVRGTDRFVVAMMCGEEDPLDCHRGLMITPALVERGILPGHLRGDGRVESTEEMERLLLKETGVGEAELGGLFDALLTPEDRGALLAEAYRRRARKTAFRRDSHPTP